MMETDPQEEAFNCHILYSTVRKLRSAMIQNPRWKQGYEPCTRAQQWQHVRAGA